MRDWMKIPVKAARVVNILPNSDFVVMSPYPIVDIVRKTYQKEF